MTVTVELPEETAERLNALPAGERDGFVSAAIDAYYLMSETPADLWRSQQKRRELAKIDALVAQARESLELVESLRPERS